METKYLKQETERRQTESQQLKLVSASWLLAASLLATGIGGGFAPWIWREGVALRLTAPGLAEFVKFLPEIRSGEIEIERLYFLLPLFLAMLAIPFFAPNQRLRLPAWLRWILRLAVIPLALAALSPVWTPDILRAPEFRLQTILAIVALGLAFFAPLFKALPLKPLVIALTLGGVSAIALPAWQFSLIQASVVEAYREPVALGWGWWLTVGGIVVSILAGVYTGFFVRDS